LSRLPWFLVVPLAVDAWQLIFHRGLAAEDLTVFVVLNALWIVPFIGLGLIYWRARKRPPA